LSIALKQLGKKVQVINFENDFEKDCQYCEYIIYNLGVQDCTRALRLIARCDYKILLSTPDLSSIESLHRLTKNFLDQELENKEKRGFQLLINKVKLLQDRDILYTLPTIYKSFLGLTLSPLESIYYDAIIPQAAQKGVAPIIAYPDSHFSKIINQIAKALIRTKKSRQYIEKAINSEGL
jgi:MinD-like ATPase involved in chromosome partitioning or flagellar assembly